MANASPRLTTGWRRRFRRELVWLLTLKFAALALLWMVFFPPAHRPAVDGESTSRHFAVTRQIGKPAAGRSDLVGKTTPERLEAHRD